MSAFYVTGDGDGGAGAGGDQIVCVVRSTIQSFTPRVQAALRDIIRQVATTSASFPSEAALSDSSSPLGAVKHEKDLQRLIHQALAMFITPWTILADVLDPDLPLDPQVMRFVRSSRLVERIALPTSAVVTRLAVLPELLDELNLMAELQEASTWWTSHESVVALRRIHNADKEVRRLDQAWKAQLSLVRRQLALSRGNQSGTSSSYTSTIITASTYRTALATLFAIHPQRRQAAIELAQALDVPGELEDLYEQEMASVQAELQPGSQVDSTVAATAVVDLGPQSGIQDNLLNLELAGMHNGHEVFEQMQEDRTARAASVRVSAMPVSAFVPAIPSHATVSAGFLELIPQVVSIAADPSGPSDQSVRRSARIALARSAMSPPISAPTSTDLARGSSSTRQPSPLILAATPANNVPSLDSIRRPTLTPRSRSSDTHLSVAHVPSDSGSDAVSHPRPPSASNPQSRSGPSNQSRKFGPTTPDTALIMHRQNDGATLIYLFFEFKLASYAAREHMSNIEQLHIFKRKEGFWQTVWYLWMISLSPSNSRLHVVATIVNDRLVRLSLDPDRSRLYVEHNLDDDQIAVPLRCRELDALDAFWSTERFGTSIGSELGFHRMIALQTDAIRRAYKDMLAELGDASGAQSESQSQPAPSLLSLESTDRIIAAMAWQRDEYKKSYENAKSRVKARGGGGPPGGGGGPHPSGGGRGGQDGAQGSGQGWESHAQADYGAAGTQGSHIRHPGATGADTPLQDETYAPLGETCSGFIPPRLGKDASNFLRPIPVSPSSASFPSQESSSPGSTSAGDPLAWTRCRRFFTGPDAPPVAVLLISTANMDRVVDGQASLHDIWGSAGSPDRSRAAAPVPTSPASSSPASSSSSSSAPSDFTGISSTSDSISTPTPGISPTSAIHPLMSPETNDQDQIGGRAKQPFSLLRLPSTSPDPLSFSSAGIPIS